MARLPASRAQLRAILRSPSYVEADQDPEFLNRPEVRGLRLQLDYTKAEVLLEDHQIRSTIVVLGSTRVTEPAAAGKRVAALRSALAMRPRDTMLASELAAAERIAAKSHYYGGYGTLDELFETLALVQSRKMGRIPIVLVGEHFWRAAVNFDFLRAEGVIDAADLELFSFAENAADIWRTITRHYRPMN